MGDKLVNVRGDDGRFIPGVSYKYTRKKTRFGIKWRDIVGELLEAKEVKQRLYYTKPNGELVHKEFSIKTDSTIQQVLCLTLIEEGLKGNVLAIREIMDRTGGKVTLTQGEIEKNCDDEAQVRENLLTDEEKVVMLRALEDHQKRKSENDNKD